MAPKSMFEKANSCRKKYHFLYTSYFECKF